jgi:predicted ATP-dependent endonuclease of OLD family
MRSLGHLSITNFRSIRRFDGALSDLTVLTGANNTGKSNLLSALHLYFRGQTAPGVPFSFAFDYPKFLEKANRRRETRIAVTFALPACQRSRKWTTPADFVHGYDPPPFTDMTRAFTDMTHPASS